MFSKIFRRGGAAKQGGRFISAPPPKEVATLERMWEAAMTDTQTLGWFGDLGITALSLRTQLWTIRRRCREAAKNDPYVCRALQLYRNNVIGAQGVKLNMDVRRPKDGGDGDESDLDASGRLEEAWKLWAESPEYCDIEGRKTLVAFLQAAVREWKLEGEAIIHIAHSPLNPFGVELKLYRADQLAVDIIRQRSGDERAILNGVEVDDYGRPVAFWFRTQMGPSGLFTGEPYIVPARQILHLFDPDEPGQTRGVPIFANVLKDLRIAHGYDLAELIAARIDACRVGTWKNDGGGDTSQISDYTPGIGYTDSTEPGEARIAGEGWDFKPDAPSRPNAGYGQFKKDVLRRVASGLSVSYNTLANDLEGVSYSSIRAGTLEDREVYKLMQQSVIDNVLRPLFRRRDGWLDSFLASPMAARFGFTPADADRLRLADNWLPRRWSWVDPHSESMANEIAVAHHWTTNTDIAAESGKDFYSNVDTAKQESDWMQEKGVEYASTSSAPVNTGNGNAKQTETKGKDTE